MYDPHTLVWSFPHYDSRFSVLEPVIGIQVWHKDPERHVPGQRSDDSCGWFPRNLTPEFERAVAELGKKHNRDIIQRVEDAFATSYTPDVRYRSFIEMPMWVAFPTHLMVLQQIDRIAFKRRNPPNDLLIRLASKLAFSTVDNLNGPWESPERYIRLLAACYRREIRPWWKHPRWHFHHWEIHFSFVRAIKRWLASADTHPNNQSPRSGSEPNKPLPSDT